MKSLNIDPDKQGLATEPTALFIDKVEVTTYQGKVNNIGPVVATISIIESIYSTSLLFEIGIKDQSNLIEDLPFIGQEKVTIFARKKGLDDEAEKEITLDFKVTEIPTYARGESLNEQVYVIKGISEFAYNNFFKKICRSYREPAATEIEKILVKDLLLPEDKFNVTGDDISKSKGVINIQRPLTAAEFFRASAFDEKGSPFMLFQTLNGNVNFISLAQMLSTETNAEYGGAYYLAKNINAAPGGEKAYAQKRKNIINIESKLNLSKINQARAGAFASQINVLDWSNKTYKTQSFNYFSVENKNASLDGNKTFSRDDTVFDTPLDSLFESHTEYLSQNLFAHPGFDNYGTLVRRNKASSNSYNALLETFTHDIRLPGDLQLNAGRKIRINFPKAKDPTNLPQSDLTDELISGTFLITSCAHVIQGGEYFCDIRVKRDSFSIDLQDETNIGFAQRSVSSIKGVLI